MLLPVLQARARARGAVRRFFEGRGYLEVDTPACVPSPGLDLHLDAFEVDGRYLITSPEYQMKRLLCGGASRIFQLARCFRRGELGGWHEPEFTMLEWYCAGAGVADMMDETEALVRALVVELGGSSERTVAGRRVDLAQPFERMVLTDAFARFAGVSAGEALRLASEDEDSFFRLLVDRVEPALATLPHGVFLHDYPASQASLARLKASDPRVCERFELYVAGLELCNGFGELTDAVEQRRRLEHDRARRAALGKPVYPIDERFLAALAAGMPPCAGNALGFDRLLAVALDARAVADVMVFPSRDL